ncbi:MAG: Cna B-type domain-containing protein [Tissierellia bacterium]|nr:Cna B-type domain-containing protein [Tissierellia bacterium]
MNSQYNKNIALVLVLTIILSIFGNFTVMAESEIDVPLTEIYINDENIETTESIGDVESDEDDVEDNSIFDNLSNQVDDNYEKNDRENPVESEKAIDNPEAYTVVMEKFYTGEWIHNNVLPRANFASGYTTKIIGKKDHSKTVNMVLYNDITEFDGRELVRDDMYINNIRIPQKSDADKVIVYGKTNKSENWEIIYTGDNPLIENIGNKNYLFVKAVFENVTQKSDENNKTAVAMEIEFKPKSSLISEVQGFGQNDNPVDVTNFGAMTIQDSNGNWIWEKDGTNKISDSLYKVEQPQDEIGKGNASYNGFDTKDYRLVEEVGEIEVLRAATWMRVFDWLSLRNIPSNDVEWNKTDKKYNINHVGPIYMPGGMQNLGISDATYVMYLPKNIFLEENFTSGSTVMWAERIGDQKAREVKTEMIELDGVQRQKVTITIEIDGIWLAANAVWKDIPLYTKDIDTYRPGTSFSFPTRFIVNGQYTVGDKDYNFHELNGEHKNNTGPWYKDELGSTNTPDKSKLVDNGVNDWVYAVDANGEIPDGHTVIYDSNDGVNAPIDIKSPHIKEEPVKVLDEMEMKRDGYQFMGWNTEADGTGDRYLPESEFAITQNMVFYAQWEKQVNIDVSKVWDDGNDADGIRPNSINVQLYKDGVEEGEPISINDSNDWKYTWKNQDDYRMDETKLVYLVKEVDVPKDYTEKYIEDSTNRAFIIYNYHEPASGFNDFLIWDWNHGTGILEEPYKLHRAYINGYPDGSVRPQGEITRGEVAAIMSRLHADAEEIEYGIETDYSDVNATDWYAKHISYVSDKGLMEGYENGTFRPEEKITRAEYATVVARFQKLEQVETSFEDSKDHWASGYIGVVYNKGWITGYPDGTFKPTANISREEVATMTNKMLDRNVDGKGIDDLNIKKFTDLEFGTWSYYEMVEASNTHEYVRRSEHTTVENWKNIK